MHFLKTLSLILAAALLSACASMTSSPAEVKAGMKANEGVVIGAIFVTAEQVKEEDKGFSFFKAKASEDSTYHFSFRTVTDSFMGALVKDFKTRYTLEAKPGVEAFFIRSLPPGDYEFIDIQAGGSDVKVPFNRKFTVTPGKALYLGHFEFTMPARLIGGAKFSSRLKNKVELAKSKLSVDYPEMVDSIVQDAMLTHFKQ